MVVSDDKESREARVKHGVPQGSILGPLFLITIHFDLPLHVNSQLDLYADDTTVAALQTSATWQNWNTHQTALSMNYGLGQRTTTTTTTNFIENWKKTNYVTFPPANSL